MLNTIYTVFVVRLSVQSVSPLEILKMGDERMTLWHYVKITWWHDDIMTRWHDNMMTGSFADDWPYGIFLLHPVSNTGRFIWRSKRIHSLCMTLDKNRIKIFQSKQPYAIATWLPLHCDLYKWHWLGLRNLIRFRFSEGVCWLLGWSFVLEPLNCQNDNLVWISEIHPDM